MKKFIFLSVSLVVIVSFNVKSQVHFEFGGGYLFELPNQNAFQHTNGGWQLNGTVVYQLTGVIELKSSAIYQQRKFDPNSFQFVVPMVVGYPIPSIKSGDNLNSFSFFVGGRFITDNDKLLKPTFSLDAGFTYLPDSYYQVEYRNAGQITHSKYEQKYFDNTFLFEGSAGFGFIVSLKNNLDFVIEAKANYLPTEKTIYFPVVTNLRVNI